MNPTPTVAALCAAFALAAPGSAPAATGSGLTVATAAVERLPLPAGIGAGLRVDPLGASLFVPARDPAALLRFVTPRLGTICPAAAAEPGGVRLSCRTRRLAASLASGSIEVRELRGVPWRAGDDGPPSFAWDTVALGGGPCPGATPAAAGECALAAGRPGLAERRFLAALDGPDHAWAAVRLGDLAAAADRLEDAIVLWRRAGFGGPFARLAAVRLCELTGSCLDSTGLAARYDPFGLPAPLKRELTLRSARVMAFLGSPASAARGLLALPHDEREPTCGRAELLCRRLVLEALRAAGADEREEALALYLSLPGHDRGPLSVELARAGAEAAASLGAPVFAGNLLAAVAANVPTAEQPDHLLRAAELYVAGDDAVRATVILDFARTRLPPKRLAEPRWTAVAAALAAAGATPAAPGAEAPAVDPALERARAALERARALGATNP